MSVKHSLESDREIYRFRVSGGEIDVAYYADEETSEIPFAISLGNIDTVGVSEVVEFSYAEMSALEDAISSMLKAARKDKRAS
jgi:hypothetical protein